jgi:MYXO-CTERM domain-containing protein
MQDQGTSTTWESNRFSRLSAVLALSATALLTAVGPAGAVDIPDRQAALDVVKSADVHNAVCRFLGVPLPEGGSGAAPVTIPDKADPCEGLPVFTVKDPLVVNQITPGFVAGTALPIATEAIAPSHLVSSLDVTVNGRKATVMLAPTQGGGWHLAAVRDGDSDTTYAGRAGVGAPVFTEPQLHAWYQLRLTTVEPLNDQAKQGLGGQSSLSLGDYQKLVKARYADKLPGSDYDTKGVSCVYATADTADDSSPSTPLIVGGSSAALALAGGAVFLRRRRRENTG